MKYFKFFKKKEQRPVYDERWFFPEINRPGVLRRWIIGTFALITFGALIGDISNFITNFIELFYSGRVSLLFY